MIESQSYLVPVSAIQIPPDRQRKYVSEDAILDLAGAIKETGLINAVVVNKLTNELIAGWTRLNAFKLLAETSAPCKFDDYANWSHIVVRYAINATPEEIERLELFENIKRNQLQWFDEAKAFAKIHLMFEKQDPEWTMVKTAVELSYSASHAQKAIAVGKSLLESDDLLKKASSIRSAYSIIERNQERAINSELDKLTAMPIMIGMEANKPVVISSVPELQIDLGDLNPSKIYPGKVEVVPASPTFPQSIFNIDFISWADGTDTLEQKFNFLHCDFPYGIDHQKSEQGNMAKFDSHYEDGEEVYWELCAALCRNRDKIITPSAHIMFWFSMEFYEQTIEFFRKNAPDLIVNKFPMMWHKTDGGMMPAADYEPRRNYETAFLINRGRRKIVRPVSNVKAAPVTKELHVSEKPEVVLAHFFQMFVDEYTVMLDPTCGSGTSVRQAFKAKARHAEGFEINPTMAADAQLWLNRSRRGG